MSNLKVANLSFNNELQILSELEVKKPEDENTSSYSQSVEISDELRQANNNFKEYLRTHFR